MISTRARAGSWPSVNPGMFRHQAVIQHRGSVPTSAGRSQPWVNVWQGYVAIKALTEKEFIQQGQITAQCTHIITLRWPGVNIVFAPGMQVIVNGKTFKVQLVDNVDELNVIIRLPSVVLNETS